MEIITSKRVEQRAYPAGVTNNFYLYGEIGHELNDYVDMITTLDLAEEQDTVNIYINTPGGSLDTTISIIHAILRSKAHVTTHADGQVASAGTIIFFAADSFIVYPYAHGMFHVASGGAVGKIPENLKNAVASSNLVNKLMRDLYIPYFSEEEVDDILEGKDYYCDSDELHDRVVAGVEIKQKQYEEEQKEKELEKPDAEFDVF